MTKEEIQEKIDKNRNEINDLMFKDIDLALKYARIRMLSAKNQMLITMLKNPPMGLPVPNDQGQV